MMEHERIPEIIKGKLPSNAAIAHKIFSNSSQTLAVVIQRNDLCPGKDGHLIYLRAVGDTDYHLVRAIPDRFCINEIVCPSSSPCAYVNAVSRQKVTRVPRGKPQDQAYTPLVEKWEGIFRISLPDGLLERVAIRTDSVVKRGSIFAMKLEGVTETDLLRVRLGIERPATAKEIKRYLGPATRNSRRRTITDALTMDYYAADLDPRTGTLRRKLKLVPSIST